MLNIIVNGGGRMPAFPNITEDEKNAIDMITGGIKWKVPLGEYVLVANRDYDNVVDFNRDKDTGQLTYSGEEVSVHMAVCVTLLVISE